MKIFAIETSCDETATAIVDVPARRIIAQHVYSQYQEHAPYGGVIPELASRAHLERLPGLAQATLGTSGLSWNDITAIAATTGPGLTTALLIGSTFAQTLALALGKPFLPTNHIEAHALSPLLSEDPTLAEAFFSKKEQILLLLVSGGHCELILVHAVGHYEKFGGTLDDAVGECFDKVGKLLGLPHPAGPAIEQLAKHGTPNPAAHLWSLPRPKNDATLDFSFSGLKTAVRDLLATHPNLNPADVAAVFQHTCATILARKAGLALQRTGARHLVAAGGVAANATIRAALQAAARQHGATFTAPPLALCTDNAAMIAYTAGLRLSLVPPTGTNPVSPPSPLQNILKNTRVRPRWPLAEMNFAFGVESDSVPA